MKKYRFEEVGRYGLFNKDTIEVENRKEKFHPAIYAIVTENRVKYIGSTTQRGRERRLALTPGKHKIIKCVCLNY